jgi:ubiquinone/menaquinone biosynthesis C-methylase UbiE
MKEQKEKGDCLIEVTACAGLTVIVNFIFCCRMGSKFENWTLYPNALQEMSRVTTPKTGRVCLLTQDKKCINKVRY